MTADPFDDQFDAASQEAAKLFSNANSRIETVERACTDGSIGAAIGERFGDSLEQETARSCPHVAGAPQPVYGSANLPGLVGCLPCMIPLITAKHHMERMETGGRICDACGDRVQKWHDSLIQRGPLLLLCKVCCFCMSMSELEPEHDDRCQEG